MRKLLRILVLTAGLFPVVVQAQTKYPDWASNGPALIGASNGIAPLDSSKNITNPVIGDTSSSSVTAVARNAPVIGPTSPQLMADDGYIHSLGAATVNSGGDISPAKLGEILRSASRPLSLHISSGESIPAGQSSTIALPAAMSNSVMIQSDGQLFNSSDAASTNAAWNGGNESKYIGDGVLVQSFEPRWGIMRDREYNDSSSFDYMTHKAPAGITSDFYTQNAQWVEPDECKSTSDPNYNGWWCDISNNKPTVHYDNIINSSIVGVNGRKMNFYSSGQGHWKSDDVGDWIRMNMSGTSRSTNMSINGSLYLGQMSRSAIMAIASPVEGQKVFDTDDHVEVVYRCITSSTCAWSYTQYMVPVTYSALPSSPFSGFSTYCSDCYSKLREDGDTSTGIMVYWNGTKWVDALGISVQH